MKRKRPGTTTSPKAPRRSMAEIEQYWDTEANGGPMPASLSPWSRRKCHWCHVSSTCGCRHTWTTTVASMTRPRKDKEAIGCITCTGKSPNVRPCCVRRSLVGDARFRRIADQWSPTNPRSPESYYPTSGNIVTWVHMGPCGCQHQWKTTIANRNKIPGTNYKVDGYDPVKGDIYEYHGNAFHGYPPPRVTRRSRTTRAKRTRPMHPCTP